MSDMSLGQQGVLQVIPPAQLELQLQQRAKEQANANQPAQAPVPTALIGFIKGQFEIFQKPPQHQRRLV